jgi:hypothetical protein
VTLQTLLLLLLLLLLGRWVVVAVLAHAHEGCLVSPTLRIWEKTAAQQQGLAAALLLLLLLLLGV